MALTRDFKDTVKDRADRDPEFRNGLLTEALEAVVHGELEVAKILLRDYINATEGFEAVGKAIGKSPKSLMRMLSQDGNPNCLRDATSTVKTAHRATSKRPEGHLI